MPQHTCKRSGENLFFSPSIMWVLGIKHKSEIGQEVLLPAEHIVVLVEHGSVGKTVCTVQCLAFISGSFKLFLSLVPGNLIPSSGFHEHTDVHVTDTYIYIVIDKYN